MRGQIRIGACVASLAVAAVAAVAIGAVAADQLVTGAIRPRLVNGTAAPASATATATATPTATATATPARTIKPPPRVPVPIVSSPATSAQRSAVAAASYATAHGYQVAVAVLDTTTGRVSTAGDADSAYASESVMKTFIAARLLATGQMTGWVAKTAWKMITQSDDASANALYGLVGGDGVVTWAASYFHVADLGEPPARPGWWGGTQITASGLVRFYAAVKRDPNIGGWLVNAMHHAGRHGSDGFDQLFGIAAASPDAAIKQGWGFDDENGSASLNSTGLVNGDRYAVAILMRGPRRSYPAAISATLTRTAEILMPGGVVPPEP